MSTQTTNSRSTEATKAGEHVGSAQELTTWQTLQRGFALSPELRRGLFVTIALAIFSTLGRVLVPIAVQQTLDRGILAEGGPQVGTVTARICPTDRISMMPPNCTNWLMVSTSLVTRETSAPRRAVLWVSIDRSWMCRKPLTRNVASPLSLLRNNRRFTA